MQIDTTLMAKSEKELKSLLMKVKEESEKVDLKSVGISMPFTLNFQQPHPDQPPITLRAFVQAVPAA